MSGELVVLAGPAMAPLVRATAALEERRNDCAIVGGVAVAVRVGQAHRATSDVDAVVDETVTPPIIDVLYQRDDAEPHPSGQDHRVVIGGVKVELLPVERLALDADLGGLTDLQTLFVSAHSHALASATLVTIASDSSKDRATVRVARSGALVGMKLHAVQDRRGDTSLKRAGDVTDLHELLVHRLDDVISDLADASDALRAAVAGATGRILVDGAARARSWLQHGDARMAAVTEEELRELGGRLLERIS